MRFHGGWGYRPYLPLERMEETEGPVVVRLAPCENGVELEWLYDGEACVVLLADGGERLYATKGNTAKVDGLAPQTDYRIAVRSTHTGRQSRERVFRTGSYPGAMVNYLHPDDDAYAFSGNSLCSPSLARLPSGGLLCSMDVYASQAPQDLSFIFRSDDGGKTWAYVTDLYPCFWGKLFWHRGALYMISVAREYGDLLIGRSDDEGRTWSAPVCLLAGSGHKSEKGPHKGPMPVLSHNGRLWTALDYGRWGMRHSNALISIDENDDLLVPGHWSMTGMHVYDPQCDGAVPEGEQGCVEGNAVVSPDGALYNFLRYATGNYPPKYGRALFARADASDPDAPLIFDRIIEFTGATSKFTVLRDDITGAYFAITNVITDPEHPGARNVLALQTSVDLFSWNVAKILIDKRHEDPRRTGLQYVDFLFDGDDIVYACRTAVNGARNYHDANCTIVDRITRFRQYLCTPAQSFE